MKFKGTYIDEWGKMRERNHPTTKNTKSGRMRVAGRGEEEKTLELEERGRKEKKNQMKRTG